MSTHLRQLIHSLPQQSRNAHRLTDSRDSSRTYLDTGVAINRQTDHFAPSSYSSGCQVRTDNRYAGLESSSPLLNIVGLKDTNQESGV
jgi:hypothetical protein